MRNRLNATTIAALILAFPIAALADLGGTPTLSANTALNLETGATAATGGDILWNGSSITMQGSATAYNFGPLLYSSVNQQVLQLANTAGQFSKAATVLFSANAVIGVKTNNGYFAKIQLLSVSGTSISIQFVTYGVSGAAGGPTITQVLNNYGLVPAGFPNSGIAQGSLFIIKGTGLADPNAQAVLQSSADPGLPTTLNGASVKVTVNGTTTVPVFYYAIAAQLALVLPSNTPIGTAQVTATYNNQTSAPFSFQVVQSAVGLDSYYGPGSGLGVATNAATGFLYNYANSIPPGTTVTLWGSGLGADPARDVKFVQAVFSINSLAHVYVGGVEAQLGYQGASSYPGLNQINITIPTSAPTGCNVSLIGVTTAGVPTNSLSLPIGSGACSDTQFGNIGSTLNTLSAQTSINSGALILALSTSPASTGSGTQTTDAALGTFQKTTYNGGTYGSSGKAVSLGGCVVSQTSGTGTSNTTTTGLDAGNITVTGPAGSSPLTSYSQLAPGSYLAQLTAGFIPASGGTFTFQNGSGGKDVGPFSAQVVFPTPLLTWTNQSAAAIVTRSAGLPIAWSGGSAGTLVYIFGNSSATVGGQSVSASFTCYAPQSALQFTVPNYILAALPAGTGDVTVGNYTTYQSFSATGLDVGAALGAVTYDINATFN
jgi:uncharacterized protein (TIGR03437 family)